MKEKKIAVLGLGYVGLPLALQLSLSYNVVGYDIDNTRIKELRKVLIKHLKYQSPFLKSSKKIVFFSQHVLKISRIVIFILLLFQHQLM